MRLNKFLAQCGIGARRKCDELIFNGKVEVNGKIIKEPWFNINTETDIIKVNNKPVTIESKIYIALNKPANVLCTLKDDFNRKIITDLLKGIKARVYPVGRLDYDVKGIILLTNDGELANRLIHPKYKVSKTYIVKVKGKVSTESLKKLEKGVILDDGKKTLPAKTKLIKISNYYSIVELEIKEGRKRQVKRMFQCINHPVIELKRIKFATITLNGLKEGEWRYLNNREVKRLYEITNAYNIN